MSAEDGTCRQTEDKHRLQLLQRREIPRWTLSKHAQGQVPTDRNDDRSLEECGTTGFHPAFP